MFKYEAIFSNVLATSVLPVIRGESIKIAEKIRKEVIRRIENQVALSPELSARYHRRKIKFNYATKENQRILMMTRQYIDSIVVIPTEYGATVGVKNVSHWTPILTEKAAVSRTRKTAKARGGGYKSVPMIKLAEWLEYGTTMSKHGRGGPRAGQPWHIPPRPHWRPAQQKFIRELGQTRERITKAMSEAMQRALEIEFNNSPDSDGITPPRFKTEIQTRGKYKVRLNQASRLMNRMKHREYEKVGLPPPEDVDDVEDL